MPRTSPTIRWGIIGALAIALGCSPTSQPNYSKLGLVDVSGIATLDGKPLANVEIRLETPEDLIYSYGVTDAQGRFRLMFDSRKPGIIPGRKRLIVVKKAIREQDEAPGDARKPRDPSSGAESSPSEEPVIPHCYGRESTTYVDIDASTNRIELELKSDCS
ncbi:MAG: hypothetical protein ACK553_05995 [Planctomycetota bacterium]|jgi:hypothetical protein